MIQRLTALAIVLALGAAAFAASENAAHGQGIEQPPPRPTATGVWLATKTCHDVFDAKVAQHMPDRSPGDIRNIVIAGQPYALAASRDPNVVWAFPANLALGVVKVSRTCFE